MRKFDYSFLDNGLLPANMVTLTANIASLKTMAGVRKEEYGKIFTELEAKARIQSIKSSNAVVHGKKRFGKSPWTGACYTLCKGSDRLMR